VTSSMGMGMAAQQRQGMRMRASPSLIAFTEMLQLGGLELQDLIVREVADNPALELVDVPDEPTAEDLLQRELIRAAQREVAELDEEAYDVFRTVADQRSLEEHLLIELVATVDHADRPIAEFMVGELDDRGFLGTSLATIAATFGASAERVERVLHALQSVGPLGLGARDVAECLKLQLSRWAELGVDHPVARAIVEGHLEALAQGRYGHIAEALGVAHDAVVEARDFIRSHLRPYPIAERTDLEPWDRQTGPGTAAPDVIVRWAANGTPAIEITGSRRQSLEINRAYHELGRRLAGSEPGGARTTPALTDAERAHVQAQLERASQFMAHLDERRSTMLRVATYVMGRQIAYLRHGPRHLLPLTRAQVAEAIDVHESTVSRATADKYVMLPSRQVVPYALFFKASLSVQDVLRELVAMEDHPLTDAELQALLAEQGYRIARRTVAKYRNEMGILPSSLR